MAHDPDRRFRNEPERVETEAPQELGPERPPEPAWMPETNSGRAAMAHSVRAWRSAEGAGKVSRGAQAPVAQAMSSSSGRSLDARSQTAGAQAGFGDLSGVQVHTDAAAADAASSIGARAFAVGNDIFFGAGYYQPGSEKGDALLGHELAHTAQQRGAATQVQTKLEVSTPGESMEVEADQAGSVFARAARGEAVSPVSLQSTGQVLARDVETSPQPATTTLVEQNRDLLNAEQARGAVAFNRGRRLPADAWSQIATVVGAASSEMTTEFVQQIARWQMRAGLSYDGRVGEISLQRMSQSAGGQGLEKHVHNEDIVYFGMNPESRAGELGVLRNNAQGNVTGAIGERQQDTAVVNGNRVSLNEDAGLDTYMSQFSKLDPGRQTQLREWLKGSAGGAKDELAQLARIFYDAETGKRLMKRMVMSGHSGGTSLYGHNADYSNHQSINFSDLNPLTSIFPMAMGQVEDLMLSACNTGWTDKLDAYKTLFPNLRSIWGYVGYSPAYGGGAERHILNWEKGSRGTVDQRKMDAAREKVAQGSGKNDKHVALWTREHGVAGAKGKETYQTDSEEATYSFDVLKQTVDSRIVQYFDPAYRDGNIDQQNLNELYSQLHALVGNHASALGADLAHYQGILKKTLYLRHWSSIARHFMDTFGDRVRAGYQSARAETPAYATLGRAQALAKIAAYPGDKGGEAFKLLTQYLRDLDPTVIPDAWN
ncbi:MAG TPA: DUF4157 domain-containing protein [Kofleriaceae bacterium]|nr:DUF4157 domain-containing protein [Kofleriaceae bacterium]